MAGAEPVVREVREVARVLPVRQVRLDEAVEVALDRLPRLGLFGRARRELREDLARLRPREDGARLERLEVAREALDGRRAHPAEVVGRRNRRAAGAGRGARVTAGVYSARVDAQRGLPERARRGRRSRRRAGRSGRAGAGA